MTSTENPMHGPAEVISLSERRAGGRWLSSLAACSACRWLFTAVMPEVDADALECPNCGEQSVVVLHGERKDVVVIYDAPNHFRLEPVE